MNRFCACCVLAFSLALAASAGRLTVAPDGSAREASSGLAWMTRDFRLNKGRAPKDWYEALAWAAEESAKRAGGRADWRLPTAGELRALLDAEGAGESADGLPLALPDVFARGGGGRAWTAEMTDHGEVVTVDLVRYGAGETAAVSPAWNNAALTALLVAGPTDTRSLTGPRRFASKHLEALSDRALQKKDAAAALQYARQMLAVAPQGYDALFQGAWSLEKAGQFVEAERAYAEAAPLFPHNLSLPLGAGRAAAARNDRAAAEQWYRRAAAADDSAWQPWKRLGDLYAAGKKDAESLPFYEAAVKRAPARAVLHYDLGYALKATKQYARAAAELQEAVRLDPDLVDAYMHLGYSLLQLDRNREALEAYACVLDRKPNDAAAQRNVKLIEEGLGLPPGSTMRSRRPAATAAGKERPSAATFHFE